MRLPPRWLWFLLGTVVFIHAAAQSRSLWLPWIAQNLILEDEPRPSELIVVFAAAEERARHASRLYQKGLAPRILVTGGLTLKGVELFCHQRVTGADFSAKVLADAGVSKDAIHVVPEGTSTYEEAEVIKVFMEKNGYRSVVAVSSPYHMRRVRASLSHIFQGTGIKIQYSPAEGADFKAAEWWRHERDLIQVTNEYLKLAYYHLALF